ncbi:GntR family transcriptional regulator [Amycolatopsis sp. H20-H5]|uniref:GntR family transcriptional regulator n=1 Tax=Amycolatopsis sp. H20-H5 TaxID=3046309 RepID=UPI002DBAC677|nr:GntR family transcriptional regulator [Amycolatopsis sp. H20-H5]MEC3980137.1 GntR family transcriptional regulator [Amycolatopsis sp. H20-H5]
MYMYQKVGGKKQRLVGDLTELIHTGRLANGDRLPGENQLAERYQVSRGTVRSALSELQRQELIDTQTGVGSFVTFDGVTLDQQTGWARALADSGSQVTTELISISKVVDELLSDRYGVRGFISVRRLRRDEVGVGISLEEALVPGLGELADLPTRGLVDDSLTETLRVAGRHAVSGYQWISTEQLDDEAAQLLGRGPREQFLRSVRTSVDAQGELVEHVISLLDPARFQFHLTFGTP